MTTTIKSTQLDFEAIKNNLKTFLAEKEEFSDYNFEASGLSNILDVLAYNTHYNALIANFALNEAYLTTAQLRNSVVSISESLGYIPSSKTSSRSTLKITINLSDRTSNRPSRVSLPALTAFTTQVDGITYTFQTTEEYIAEDEGGIYRFHPIDAPEEDCTVFEGLYKEKTFLVGKQSDNTVYVIPDEEIDVDTAIVKVFSSPSTDNFVTYTNLIKATTVTTDSSLYILKESPNKFFELSFGVGGAFGKQPISGNKITVEYLRSSGAEANGAAIFVANNELFIPEIGISTGITATTITKSSAGGDKESVESIRKNAPFQYASQNRMVTALDYSALILKNFSSVIDDIKSWGGEQNDEPEYGTVFTSIKFKDGLTNASINLTKRRIKELAKQLSVVSFDLKFFDPDITWLQTNIVFQFNPSLTGLSRNAISSQVNNTVLQYFEENTGRFDEVFRRSNLLTLVDDVDPSILSSRAEIKMQKRITPIFGLPQKYSISFPVSIESPTTTTKSNSDELLQFVTNSSFQKISTSLFIVNNRTVAIRNSLNRKVKVSSDTSDIKEFIVTPTTNLELYEVSSGEVIIDSIGYYDPNLGVVIINSLEVQSIVGGKDFIKITAIPANQSVLPVDKNQVIRWDGEISSSSATSVSTT